MSPQKPVFLFFIVPLLFTLYSGCELINPPEQIPSFIQIDSIPIIVGAEEGSPYTNITDAWVYENEQLIGTYELPATIPILKQGKTALRIRPGIKLNGQVGTRTIYPFLQDFKADIDLFADSVLLIKPALSFREEVNFVWLEDFDNLTGYSLISTNLSQRAVGLVQGVDALDGNSAWFSLNADETFFECQATNAFILPGSGVPILLEFSYKCNHNFAVGLFSRDAGGTLQTPILQLNATENWKHIYIGLTSIASMPNFLTHRPYFGLVRQSGFTGQINIYVDNIRLVR